ncbi:telomeric repeat-binding factor [Anaeramoeba flamelloides]|uniref:Telomeric repeat-binding factor n=1 Tax=Anaeramoeba flamelloides TaxID=1746091 RepID=A0AAV7YWW8_9EUKA|nr:telomeric repeat-binding factor [Anaeramoeba flamelloides]
MNKPNHQNYLNSLTFTLELLPYLQKCTPKEQVACISLITLHLQKTFTKINKQNQEIPRFPKQKELIKTKTHKQKQQQKQQREQEHKQKLKQEHEQRPRIIFEKRQKRVYDDFIEQSGSNFSDEEDDEDYIPHQELKRKKRNSLKGVKRTPCRKRGKRKKSSEARPLKFAKLRVFWSDLECNSLIDGIINYGTGKWSKIIKDPRYNFHSKRTPHDLKDKWRNLSKIDSLETIQLKYNYKQWLNRHKVSHLN